MKTPTIRADDFGPKTFALASASIFKSTGPVLPFFRWSGPARLASDRYRTTLTESGLHGPPATMVQTVNRTL
jgi:hypothetical protein